MKIKEISFCNFPDGWYLYFEYENGKKEMYNLDGTKYGSLNKNQIKDILGK